MQLPSFYQESSCEIKNDLEDFIQNYHFISSKLWEPFNKTFPAIDDIRLPAKLISTCFVTLFPAKHIQFKMTNFRSSFSSTTRQPFYIGYKA